MNKIKTTILTVGLFVIQISVAQSQVPVEGSDMLLDKLRLNKGINGVETTLYANVNGDPFIFKDFAKGKLVVNSGKKFDVFLRYDIYANEMHLKDKNEVYAIIHPEKVMSLEVDSMRFIYSKFVKSSGEKTTNNGSYFIVAVEGKCKLLVKKNMRIQESEPPKLYQDAKPAKFVPTKDTYYLKLKDESAVKFRNVKEFLSVLADKKDVLSSYMKSNKLDIKDIEDLSKVVIYYNGL